METFATGRRERRGIELAMWIVLLALLLSWYIGSASSMRAVVGESETTILGHDDAYITFTYSRNLARGLGLRWTRDSEPVEGFSSFLWTVITSPFFLGGRDPFFALVVLSGFLHCAAVWVFGSILSRLGLHAVFLRLPLLVFLAIWPPLRLQALAATEFPLLVLIFLLAARRVLAEEQVADSVGLRSALVWIGLLPIIRPEGLILMAILWACWLERLPSRLTARSARKVAQSMFLSGLPFAGLVVFRLLYYGSPLPNTYYLKMEGRPDRLFWGARHVYGFLLEFPATLLFLPLLALAFQSRRRVPGILTLATGFMVSLLYVVYMGGDAWPVYRFLLPSVVLFLLALGLGFSAIDRTVLPVAGALAWSLVIALAPSLRREYVSQDGLLPSASEAIVGMASNGVRLSEICGPDATIGVFGAGATVYFADLRAIDMLGKSDAHIAHQPPLGPRLAPGHDKVDYGYVASRGTDLLLGARSPSRMEDPAELASLSQRAFGRYLYALFVDPDIRRLYSAERDSQLGWILNRRYGSKCKPQT